MTDPRDRTFPEAGTSGASRRPPPERIGPYRIVDVLGEGAMGIVYRARQSAPLEREVALKILKLGLDTEAFVARFESERQSLAVMEHPAIAAVHDAGATEAGRPYFVMELVRGEPLLDFCDARRLSLAERISLFVDICRGVKHAHQKGVIHRDLKPSNILVAEGDDGPRPKIIDFGIARAVEQRSDEDGRLTLVDQMVGTPAYMSPEQAGTESWDVDTRADIYSLGVILYELLAGVLPFDSSAYRGWAALATSMVQEAPAPSRRLDTIGDTQKTLADLRRTDAVRLSRELKGELDWIVLKAIEKDRERRYQDAGDLAADLTRYLNHEPIEARPPSRVYQVRKFVRRNPVAVGLGSTLVVLLAAFAVWQNRQAHLLGDALEETALRRSQAEELLDFTMGDLRDKLAPLGRLDILDDVSDRAVAYFASVPTDQFDDEALLRRSEALSQQGQVRVEQGRRDEARALFDEALRLHGALAERDPDNGDWLYALGQSHFWVGYMHYLDGDLEAAEEPFLDYLAVSERLVELDSANLDWMQELSYAHSNMGSLHQERGELEAAAEDFRLTLAIDSGLIALDPDDPSRRLDFARSHNTLAAAYLQIGRLAEAARLHEGEVEIKEGMLAADPDNAVILRDLSRSRRFLAVAQYSEGDLAGALSTWQEATAGLRRLAARDPSDVELRRELATAQAMLAVVRAESGSATAAIPLARGAVATLEELRAIDEGNRDWTVALGRTEVSLARALALAGEGGEARVALGRALALLEPQADHGSGEARLALADALMLRGQLSDPDEARDDWRAVVSVLSDGEASTLQMKAILAAALTELGRSAEAEPLLAELSRAGYASPRFRGTLAP